MPQRARPVNLENLRIGIRKKKNKWKDHNELYMDLEQYRLQGITEKFWGYLFGTLKGWQALKPKSMEEIGEIYKEGIEKLPELENRYNNLSQFGDPSRLSIESESLKWEDVSPLFELAQSLKGMRPPTFGSKLCHFLFPSVYFIWDNNLVKADSKWIENYQTYWEDLRTEWRKAEDKESLKQELRRHIRNEPCASYPWVTKISEICQYPEKD